MSGIEQVVANSTLPIKENLLFIFATMIDILYQDMGNDIRTLALVLKNPDFKLGHEQKRDFNRYTKLVKDATMLFERAFDKPMDEQLSSWEVKDHLREDANDILRLVMLFVDRSCKNLENRDKIYAFIRSLESCGKISEKEISRFYFK